MGQKIEINREWLREKYVDEWMSATEIADQIEASPKTVLRRLKDYDIKIRTSGAKKKPLSKDKLRREYVKLGKSARQIADGEDYSRRHVQRSLEYHDMEIRSRQKAIWKRHGENATYRTHPRGHVMVGSGGDMAYVHQLVAIADGADPHKLFSGGEWHCHHKNEIPWDNRADNIEVVREEMHHQHHFKDMVTDDNGTLVKKSRR